MGYCLEWISVFYNNQTISQDECWSAENVHLYIKFDWLSECILQFWAFQLQPVFSFNSSAVKLRASLLFSCRHCHLSSPHSQPTRPASQQTCMTLCTPWTPVAILYPRSTSVVSVGRWSNLRRILWDTFGICMVDSSMCALDVGLCTNGRAILWHTWNDVVRCYMEWTVSWIRLELSYTRSVAWIVLACRDAH